MAGAGAGATGGSTSCGLAPAFDSFFVSAKVPTTAITANDAMIHVRFISCVLQGILVCAEVVRHLRPNQKRPVLYALAELSRSSVSLRGSGRNPSEGHPLWKALEMAGKMNWDRVAPCTPCCKRLQCGSVRRPA